MAADASPAHFQIRRYVYEPEPVHQRPAGRISGQIIFIDSSPTSASKRDIVIEIGRKPELIRTFMHEEMNMRMRQVLMVAMVHSIMSLEKISWGES
jgi:hypothetical protein